MQISLIKTKEEYRNALREVRSLMSAKPGSPEEERLDLLATLVDHYESKVVPIEQPDPIEAIRFMMESNGLTNKDLEPLIGSRSRVSEILNRRRPLSINMIRALHEALHIPAETLIQSYPLEQSGEHSNKKSAVS